MFRRFCSPRWLAFHLLVLALIAVFLGLGWWQLRRASAGNMLSWGYALEWPVFAGFTGFVWYRTLRDTVRPPTGRTPDGGTQDGGAEDTAADRPVAGGAPAFPVPDLPARPAAAPIAEDEDPELAAYNRYLAALADADGQR